MPRAISNVKILMDAFSATTLGPTKPLFPTPTVTPVALAPDATPVAPQGSSSPATLVLRSCRKPYPIGLSCVICSGGVDNAPPMVNPYDLPCGHFFDVECLTLWLSATSPSTGQYHSTCPYCRKDVGWMAVFELRTVYAGPADLLPGFRIQPPSRRPAPFVPAPLVPTSSITLVELEKRLAMHKKTRAWLIRTRQPTDWNDEIIAKVRKDLAAEVARLPRVFK